MKLSSCFIAASLALNGALLLVIAAGRATEPPAVAPSASAPSSAESKTPAAPGPETWETLQPTDLARQRDRLRAEGFPPAVVRAILAAQIRERYATQRKGLMASVADIPFWKSANPDPKTTAALRTLFRAERDELKALVGPDPDDRTIAEIQRTIPGLSAAKAEELGAIRERYNEAREELYAIRRGATPTPADQTKMSALETAMHDEFAKVLTPQELEEYDLNASRTATQLQYQLAAFDVTEAEYRTLYKLHAAFDAQYPRPNGGASPDEMRARREAEKQLEGQIAAALGPDRYSQYQRATDYNYREAAQLVARLELPPETTDALYTLQKEYEQKRQTIHRDPQNPAEYQQQLTALAAEATAKVTTALGGKPNAVEAYKTYGGQWLRSLAPPPARASGSLSTGATIINRP